MEPSYLNTARLPAHLVSRNASLIFVAAEQLAARTATCNAYDEFKCAAVEPLHPPRQIPLTASAALVILEFGS